MIQITNRIRGYRTQGDRSRAIYQLRKRGWNYFVGFKDVQSDYALNYGQAEWAKDRVYRKDC